MAARTTKSAKKPDKKEATSTATSKPLQKKLLLQWQAPVRPYKKLNKEVFSTILAGAFLLGVILFFIDGAMPVIALASVIFLFYVMGTVPPHQVQHSITTWGIESEDKAWPWEIMARYWIKGKKDNRMLNIQLATNFPQHLRFMLGDVDEKKLATILQGHLVEDQPKPNWLDKSSAWLEAKIKLSPES
jgi:hypothetical protein